MDEPAKGANLADSIFVDLRDQILRGDLQAGDRLTPERELALSYGSNRNTLREAVRKLEQMRLVTIHHGRGVTVSDYRRTGTAELFAPYLQSGPNVRELVRLVEDVLVPRVLFIEHATRLAVRRVEKDDLLRLEELRDLLVTAFEAKQAKVVAVGFQRWLDAIVDASHSVAIRWIANPLFDALRQLLDRMPMLWILEPSFPEHLNTVIASMIDGNEERAVQSTRDYYARVDKPLYQLLEALSKSASRAQRPTPKSGTEEEASPLPSEKGSL